MLSVIPQGGDGVAVVVAHHQAGSVECASPARTRGSGVLRKQVHRQLVERGLLGGVGVVLIRRCSLGQIQTERIGGAGAIAGIGGVRIRGDQRAAQPVDGRSARRGGELRLTGRIGGRGVGREVVIEGYVFLENHHEVLDRSRGRQIRGRIPSSGRTGGTSGAGRTGRASGTRSTGRASGAGVARTSGSTGQNGRRQTHSNAFEHSSSPID